MPFFSKSSLGKVRKSVGKVEMEGNPSPEDGRVELKFPCLALTVVEKDIVLWIANKGLQYMERKEEEWKAGLLKKPCLFKELVIHNP